MWAQTVAHGTSPNYSGRCRTAQFLKAFPRTLSFPDSLPQPGDHDGDMMIDAEANCRLVRRSRALQREMTRSGAIEVITPLGDSLFGLDVLPRNHI
jgi:hypothetical protein